MGEPLSDENLFLSLGFLAAPDASAGYDSPLDMGAARANDIAGLLKYQAAICYRFIALGPELEEGRPDAVKLVDDATAAFDDERGSVVDRGLAEYKPYKKANKALNALDKEIVKAKQKSMALAMMNFQSIMASIRHFNLISSEFYDDARLAVFTMDSGHEWSESLLLLGWTAPSVITGE